MLIKTWMKIAALWTLTSGGAVFAQAQQYPFQNPDLPIEQRIDNILKLMNVDEKIACLSTRPNVPRLGIVGTGLIEGLHGAEFTAAGHSKEQTGPGQAAGNAAGAPPPSMGHGFSTTFPQQIGMGETWDANLISKAAALEGHELRYVHRALVLLAPNADLGRDPRWGRTEECYGEDPFFNGTLVVAFIKGLQGNDPKYWQAASLMKHFLANSNENGRDSSSSDFDDRLLREYYSVPFRMGIEQGGSRAFMASYNSVNGIPQTVNPMLLHMAVNEWGQDGIICT